MTGVQTCALPICTIYTGDKKHFVSIGDLFTLIKNTDLYINASKEERRKITKKNMIEFYETNPQTRGHYNNEYRHYEEDGKREKNRNVLIGYQFINL